ncbi:MAG: hypothetical protein QM820_21340 [Minicystis sp.]
MLSVTDVSGGLDSSVVYEWLPSKDMWAVYDKGSAKYTYKETHGVDVSVFTGTKKVTLVGSESGDATTNPETVSKTYASRTESYTWAAQSYGSSYTDTRVEYAIVAETTSIKFVGASFSVAGSAVAFAEAKVYTHSIAVAAALTTYSLIGAPITYDIKIGNEWSYSTVKKEELWGKMKVEPVEAVISFISTTIDENSGAIVSALQGLANVNGSLTGMDVSVNGESYSMNAVTVITG